MNRSQHRNPVKVCFFIATLGHGRGGHFWDLKTIAEALSERIDCVVVNIGPYRSPVLDSIHADLRNIFFNGINFLSVLRKVIAIARQERIDVFNVFDQRIYFIARIAGLILHKPMLLTKCGGPNPGRHYPFSDYLVVISRENLKYFQKSRKFAHSRIYFIPNRVSGQASDITRVEKLRSRIDPEKPVFLIISRFVEAYRHNMIQGINLVKRLNQEGRKCQLLIIGVAENEAVFNEISRLESNTVRVIGEEEFTLNAGELIDVADFVIGAGRGFMEAASRGKVLLTSLLDSRFPLLITEETFEEVFATNFSPRNQVTNFDEDQNYRNIIRMLEDKDYRKELSELAKELFEKYFDVKAGAERYQELFAKMRFKKHFYPLELALALYTTLRSFASFYLPGRRARNSKLKQINADQE